MTTAITHFVILSVGASLGFVLCAIFTAGLIADLEGEKWLGQ